MTRSPLAFRVLMVVWLAPAVVIAQQSSGDSVTPAIDGPPPPVAPAVVSRDEKGGVTIRAGET
ncbi:MAG: hypothetical protein HYS05_20065 [Acidobacteria bacterium]|nr:hypothetical protein [Acidobacteriota bacterium]